MIDNATVTVVEAEVEAAPAARKRADLRRRPHQRGQDQRRDGEALDAGP
jgi:hypothetical protein